jgi:hypothetical protein
MTGSIAKTVDIFAVGLVLYELFMLAPAFTARPGPGMFYEVLNQPTPRLATAMTMSTPRSSW